MKRNVGRQSVAIGSMIVLYLLVAFLFIRQGLSSLTHGKVLRMGIDLVFLLVTTAAYIFLCYDNQTEDDGFLLYKSLFCMLFLVFWLSIVSIFLEKDTDLGFLSFYTMSLAYFGSIFLSCYFFHFTTGYLQIERNLTRYSSILIDVSSAGVSLLILINMVTRKFFSAEVLVGNVHKNYYPMFSIPIILGFLGVILFTFLKSELSSEAKRFVFIYFGIPTLGLAVGTLYRSCSVPCACGLLVLILMYVDLFNRRGEAVELAKEQLVQAEQEEKETEQRILLSQIQPHFIFNTLSVIAALAKKSPEIASSVTKDFAAYLKDNLDAISSSPLTPFSKELDHIKKYVNIQKVRFGEELTVVYDIGPQDFVVPSLSIQPLVENAIIHGIIRGKQEAGTVRLSTKEDAENNYVLIEDDGIGFDPAMMEHHDGRVHVGLKNSRERLETLAHGKLEVESTVGKGTKMTIVIPKNKEVLHD